MPHILRMKLFLCFLLSLFSMVARADEKPNNENKWDSITLLYCDQANGKIVGIVELKGRASLESLHKRYKPLLFNKYTQDHPNLYRVCIVREANGHDKLTWIRKSPMLIEGFGEIEIQKTYEEAKKMLKQRTDQSPGSP